MSEQTNDCERYQYIDSAITKHGLKFECNYIYKGLHSQIVLTGWYRLWEPGEDGMGQTNVKKIQIESHSFISCLDAFEEEVKTLVTQQNKINSKFHKGAQRISKILSLHNNINWDNAWMLQKTIDNMSDEEFDTAFNSLKEGSMTFDCLLPIKITDWRRVWSPDGNDNL